MRGCDGTPAVAELTTPSTRAWSPRTSPAGLTFRSPNAGEGDGETIVEGSEVAVARGVGDSVVAGGVHASTRAAAIRRRRIASVWRSRAAGRQHEHRRGDGRGSEGRRMDQRALQAERRAEESVGLQIHRSARAAHADRDRPAARALVELDRDEAADVDAVIL